MKTLSTLDPPAYYMGYTLTETQRADVSGSNGALLNSNEARNRWLEVSVRTGKYELDNSHKVGERQMASGGPGPPGPTAGYPGSFRRADLPGTGQAEPAPHETLTKNTRGKGSKRKQPQSA